MKELKRCGKQRGYKTFVEQSQSYLQDNEHFLASNSSPNLAFWGMTSALHPTIDLRYLRTLGKAGKVS